MLRSRATIGLASLLVLAAACHRAEIRATAAVAPPLRLEGSAYDAAARVDLPEGVPIELAGLHNVFALSARVFSGGEPHGEEGLRSIASLGVKTVLSVDGKAPDATNARRFGLRYVHVPIQYRGVTEDELLRIAKTFRELEGPFYVHCFHGQHRGPAAAAVGRLLLDGAARDLALAEMRQWCGTSPKYEGLYAAIAAGDFPSEAETAGYAWDFPEVHPLAGFRGSMIDVSRAFDRIQELASNGWQVDPEHPDVDPVNEAAILAGLFRRSAELPDVQERAADFRQWLADGDSQSTALREALAQARATADWSPAQAALDRLKATCSACHAAYRDD